MARRNQTQPPQFPGDPNEPQGMGVLLRKYLEWLRVHNYSESTVLGRRKCLGYFITWAEERGLVRPSEITKPILERYQRYLYHYRKQNGDPLSFRSQQSRLVPIRAWFKWMTRQNYLLFNPASEIELPKVEARLPKHILTVGEVEEVMAQTDVNDPLGLRDRALLETLYSTGVRRQELANLRMYDLDVERGTLMVRQGKGKKDRVVPIGDRALAWIDRYIQDVRPGLTVGNRSENTLFLTHLGEAFTPGRLSQMVRQYIDQAEIGKSGSCHLIRHTMATLMLENGADIRFIQAILGHAKLDTTQIYTQVSIRKLKEIHSLTHPARIERSK